MKMFPAAECAALLSCSAAHAQSADPLAPTGNWNACAGTVDEEKVMGSAKRIVDSGLARKGYRYINLDDGWMAKRRQPDGHLMLRADKFPSTVAHNPKPPSFK